MYSEESQNICFDAAKIEFFTFMAKSLHKKTLCASTEITYFNEKSVILTYFY